MISRKLLIFSLCIAFIFATLTGCVSPDDLNVDNVPEKPDDSISLLDPPEADNDLDFTPSEGIDFDAAIASFPPDTVMIRAGELTVTWANLFVFLFSSVSEFAQFYPMGIDWSEDLGFGIPFSDLVLEYSTDEALSFLTFEFGANVHGITPDETDLEDFNTDLENLIDAYGGKEALELSLRENGGFYSYDVFEDLLRIEMLRTLLLEDLYGEGGADFPDERIAEFAAKNDFMMAKHILILHSEHGDSEDALSEIEDIFSQLTAKVGSDDFFDFFDELMREHSEDPGSFMSYPDGYLFEPVDMVSSFSAATLALEEGEMSDIVESEYGYHIILRVPIDYDLIPLGIAGTGGQTTLRHLAVYEDFEALMEEWRSAMNIEFTSEYNSIDLSKIF